MSNKFTILIVDDESINISILAEILNSKYLIKVATNGKSALNVLATQEVDLILLDIVMPDMDGYEVAKHFKNDSTICDIPFIFLSAKSDSESVIKGKING
ncbi:MAG: response regulator [Campylobacterales bacterium]|nr:response regulator [Campylobacterales bacterium]